MFPIPILMYVHPERRDTERERERGGWEGADKKKDKGIAIAKQNPTGHTQQERGQRQGRHLSPSRPRQGERWKSDVFTIDLRNKHPHMGWEGPGGGADVCVFLRVSYSYGNASPVLFGISRRKYYIFTTYSNPLWGKFMEAPGKLLLRSCSLGLAYGLH